MVKAVFFDFWGTLVENGTYSPLKQSYSILRLRIPFGQFVEQFETVVMGKQYADQATMFTEACESFNVKPYPIVIDKLIGVWNKNRLLAKAYPECMETLKALKEKGLKIAIISNAPSNNVEPVMERYNMGDVVDKVYLSNQHGMLKTNGLFELALKEMKLKKGDVIAVGDSIETDIEGAKKAGIKAYLLDRKGKREFTPKILLLSELLKIVEE